MRFPSKITSFNESIISKFHIVLEPMKKKDFTVIDLYNEIYKKISLKDFIDILLCLYVLDEITMSKGVIRYVKRNTILRV